MQRLELDVAIREGLGKGPARRTRAQGAVPAVLYGRGADAVSLLVDARSLDRALQAGANSLIDLKGPPEVRGKLVLIKELQRDPVSRRPLHCDFYAVDTSRKIEVSVPFHFEGKAKGVELGGILDIIVREVEVSCLPLTIPDSIPVDVQALDIGDSIHLGEIQFPEGVEPMVPADLAIVHVVAPRVEEEVVEEAAVVAGEAPAAGAEGAAPAEGEEEGD